MRFELFIAARYLRAKRRQAVIGIVTAISVAGVAVGVASLILALAITTGMRRDLQDHLLSSTAHVSLMRVQNDGMRDWRALTARLGSLPHVTAVAPALYEPVLVSRGAHSGGALLKGILPAQERQVSDMLRQMTAGSADALSAPVTGEGSGQTTPPVVLGYDLADSLGAHVGDTVVVTSPQGELTPYGLVPKYQRFQLQGIFKSGFYQYDSSYAFLRLADAQRLLQKGLPVDLAVLAPGAIVVGMIAHLGVIVQCAAPASYKLAVFRSFTNAMRHWLDASIAAL